MKFYSEEEAWEYWQDAYYFSGGGYEYPGRSIDDQLELFDDWIDDQGITFLDDDLRKFIEEMGRV